MVVGMEASIMQVLDKRDGASAPVELYLTLTVCQIIYYTHNLLYPGNRIRDKISWFQS